MAVKKSGAVKPAPFDPSKLTKEQQELVVKEYLGVHPRFFLYDGLQIKLNHSRFEAENRTEAERTGKPRVWFNGWKPKLRST